MRVSSLGMVILSCGQQQKRYFNQYRWLAFTSETEQPSGFNGGEYNMPNIVKNNYFINGKWTVSLNNVFNQVIQEHF